MSENSITYISEPKAVSMAEEWFDIATVDHFWVRRRFDVLAMLLGAKSISGNKIAEIGCGHGLVQKQFEERFGLLVDGFDLNERALVNSVASDHQLYYYDVNEQQAAFRDRYDCVILFDVVEHLLDPAVFLESTKYMVKPGGRIAINVPALQILFSSYDIMAGHYRRYNIKSLSELLQKQNLDVEKITYWGMSLLPFLVMRKLLFSFQKPNTATLKRGFDSRSKTFNKLMYKWSGLEKVPQQILGSSLMAIVRKTQSRL